MVRTQWIDPNASADDRTNTKADDSDTKMKINTKIGTQTKSNAYTRTNIMTDTTTNVILIVKLCCC